jgi:5-methylcytosine-specific restriction endonuclease McrA
MSSKSNGGRAGTQWRNLEQQVLAEETHCGRCGRPIDKTLPRTSPWGATIGHIIEVDRAPHLIYDRDNVRLEHARCNYKAGGRYGRAKQLAAGTKPKRQRKQSRNW